MTKLGLRIRRILATSGCLCLFAMSIAPSIAAACEGEGGGGFVTFAFNPPELKWKTKETTAKKLEIKVVPGSDGVKLVKQKTNDETDFEPKDPNGCMGKTVLTPCIVEIKRKTTAKILLKWYQFEYEDETTHHNFNELTAVSLEAE
jgi:hypothetical protein